VNRLLRIDGVSSAVVFCTETSTFAWPYFRGGLQSLNRAARRLGRHYLTLEHYFPELIYKLNERYSADLRDRYDKDKILSVLTAAKDELPPQSVASLARQLGCSRAFLRLRFPEDCRIIAARYTEFRKVFTHPDEIRNKLLALQKSSPPLSITQCAEQLGCNNCALFRYFPEISRAIGVRYSDYIKEKARQRREFRRKAILDTLNALKAEQIYPSYQQIKKRLPHIEKLTNLEIKFLLHDMNH
jgi:hypothetical protein